MKGFTDKPAMTVLDDVFEIKQYISGLSDFILECDTPMTIAIQGDWGSGKTSMMNMIKETIGEKAVTSWFNTWQYSQFNMGDALAISFLSRLVSDLGIEKASNDNAKKILKTIGKQVALFTLGTINPFVGQIAEKVVEKAGEVNDSTKEFDMPTAINELKKQFQLLVDQKVANSKGNRVVIFIDDLDRLHPGKAVELLEVLKLFLDCDKCVFVLAIDYAVVSQGVKQKYGELLGEEKGRSFFDKIIQVPFKMPVAKYNVNNYVSKALNAVGVNVPDEEVDIYVKLIQTSVGCNPRAMKRLFNAFWLLNKVSVNESVVSVSERKVLFAVLCLQLSFEKIYNYIVTNPEECLDGSLLKSLADVNSYAKTKETDKLLVELQIEDENEGVRAANFMAVFNEVLDKDGDGKLSLLEIQDFIKILGFTTITATAVVETVPADQVESRWRYNNREIGKVLAERLNRKIANWKFKVFQSKTNSPDWKKYYSSVWAEIAMDYGKVAIDLEIRTNLKNNMSDLHIRIRYGGGVDKYKFIDALKSWYETQKFGFSRAEDGGQYRLVKKDMDANNGGAIIDYFENMTIEVIKSIEKYI